MSLYALPVTVSELETLQLGIEFYTNVPEATSEAAAINAGSTTVLAYAESLLASNVALSQVAMGVDSLMFGATDTLTELTKLSTVVLPPQVALAIKDGFNPTIYAAQALGLDLAGGNGTSNAFATNFGSLQLSPFVTAVANITNLNPTAIQGWVTNWIAFYTANPGAIPASYSSLPNAITLAAYGAAFGDAVGTDLITSPAGAQVQLWVQNALFDNAQGSYVSGIPIGSEPTPLIFQGGVFPTFTLTIGSDTVVTGQPFNGTGPVVPGSNVVVSGPLAGIFGDQPTLTSGDDIALTGLNNTLKAFFDGHDTVTAVNVTGVQTWLIDNTGTDHGTVTISGGLGNQISGLTSLTYNDNGGGSSLSIGTALEPIQGTAGEYNNFTLTVENALGGHSFGHLNNVDLIFATSALSGTDTITVNANIVGNHGDSDLDDAYAIAAGAPGHGSVAAIGFQTWNVSSTGVGVSSVNDLALGADGATTATTLTVTDDGSTTIIYASTASGSGGSADWANLTTIDASGTTGQLTITGAETKSDGYGGGLLTDNATALTSVTGGSGADLFDLSGFSGDANGLTIAGGGNTTGTNSLGGTGTGIELSNSEINSISDEYTGTTGAFGPSGTGWGGVAILYDVGTGGSGGTSYVGGDINMADFPGTLTVQLLDYNSGNNPNQNADFNVTNAPDGLFFDFNHTHQGDYNFSVIGSDTAGGVANTMTVNYDAVIDSTGTFTSQNFDNMVIDVGGYAQGTSFSSTPHGLFYSGGFVVVGNTDFGLSGGVTLTFNTSETFHTSPGSPVPLDIGNTTTGLLGVDTITLLSGPIEGLPLHPNYLDTGFLDITGTDAVTIGVTNAFDITSTTTGIFDMTSPDDVVSPGNVAEWGQSSPYGGVEVSSVSADSVLQGSLGITGTNKGFPLLVTGSDSLYDGAGSSSFFGDGGSDFITIGGGGNDIYFGVFELNDHHVDLPIEGGGFAGAGFWDAQYAGQQISGSAGAIFGTNPNDGTSADVTTVSGFTVGIGNTDMLSFNDAAWNNLSYINGSGNMATLGSSPVTTLQLITTPGALLTDGTSVVLDGINGSFASAATLAASLNSTNGDVIFGSGGLHAHDIRDMLFVYENSAGGLTVADVEFVNTTGSTAANSAVSGVHVYASDMATGIVGSLNDLVANPAAISIIHH